MAYVACGRTLKTRPCERHYYTHRRGHRRSPPKIANTVRGDRGPADGRHGRSGRFVWRRQNVPPTSGEIRTRDETIRGLFRAIYQRDETKRIQ